MSSTPSIPESRSSVRAALRLRQDALVGLGVDRLDYTKGIEERLLAVDRLLERSLPAREVRLRPTGRPEPDAHRTLCTARRGYGCAHPPHQQAMGAGVVEPVVMAAKHQDQPTARLPTRESA
jgi:trehalose 6-phosphate synthase